MFSTMTSARSTSFLNAAWPSSRFEVELDRALVAVEVLEVDAVAAADDVLARGLRRLDADHVRAPVGEMAHARRARARERQIEDDGFGKRELGSVGGRVLGIGTPVGISEG